MGRDQSRPYIWISCLLSLVPVILIWFIDDGYKNKIDQKNLATDVGARLLASVNHRDHPKSVLYLSPRNREIDRQQSIQRQARGFTHKTQQQGSDIEKRSDAVGLRDGFDDRLVGVAS